nr:hypothetical protein BSM_29530 [uncultured archaeon]
MKFKDIAISLEKSTVPSVSIFNDFSEGAICCVDFFF